MLPIPVQLEFYERGAPPQGGSDVEKKLSRGASHCNDMIKLSLSENLQGDSHRMLQKSERIDEFFYKLFFGDDL